MISSFYTAATGAIQLQKGFDVTANNIANASTTGYKTVSSSFADLVYTNIHAPEGADTQLKSGHGAKLQKTDTVYTAGTPRQTDRSLDFMLPDSNSFFAVETGDGVKYTRNGNFHLSVENGMNYLTDASNAYVLDANGQRIVYNAEDKNSNIGVFSFNNQDGLVREGNTYFTANAVSGEAAAVANPEIKTGFLEDSAVNLADEMTSVIQLQRAFQFNSKIVQVSDEIMQTVNNLR